MAQDPRFREVIVGGVVYRTPASDPFAGVGGSQDGARAAVTATLHRLRPEQIHADDAGLGLGTRVAGTAGADVVGLGYLEIDWRRVIHVGTSEPWPRMQVTWRWSGQTSREVLAPSSGRSDAMEAFAGTVARVLELAGGLGKFAVDRGWLDVPDVAWEQVSALPDDVESTVGDGVFRTSGRARAREPILARRAPRTASEALLAWLGSSPAFPWAEQPIEVAVTAEHVYVRRRDGVHRVALGLLRTYVSTEGGGSIAVFAKRTRLVLPFRPGCAVHALFESRLRASGGSE